MNRPIETTSASKVTEIKMKRQSHKGTILLVEGATDSNLFKKLLDCEQCNIRSLGGKEVIIEVLKILERQNEEGILSIVDADFEHIEGYEYKSKNLLRTETCDIEGLLLKSRALEFLFLERVNEKNLKQFIQNGEIRTILLSKAKYIGFLRILSKRNNWLLDFSNLRYGKFIDKMTLNIDVEEMVLTVLANTVDFFKVGGLEIIELVENFESIKLDLWVICNGHDIMNILLISLKNIFGKYSRNMKFEELESLLRMNYELRFFKKTKIYEGIKNWEQLNNTYKVLE